MEITTAPLGLGEACERLLSDDVVTQASRLVGAERAEVREALAQLLPGTLGLVAREAGSDGNAGRMYAMATDPPFGVVSGQGIDVTLAAALQDGTAMSEITDRFSHAVFGDRWTPLGMATARAVGVPIAVGANLVRLTVPLVLWALRDAIADQQLDEARFGRWLAEQAPDLDARTPRWFTDALVPDRPSMTVVRRYRSVAEAPAASRTWAPSLIAGLVLLAFLIWVASTAPRESQPQPSTASTGMSPMPSTGLASAVLDSIVDASRKGGPGAWLPFDRANYQDGTNVLVSSADNHLVELAEVLRAHPEVTLEIAPGDPSELAAGRADTLAERLARLGAPPDHLRVLTPVSSNTGTQTGEVSVRVIGGANQ